MSMQLSTTRCLPMMGLLLNLVMKSFRNLKIIPTPYVSPDVDWVDYVMKDAAIQTQHNLNISGGTDRVRYFISVGAYTQGGLFKEYDLPYNLSYQYRRFNYRTNLDIDVTKTTKLSINLSGNLDNSDKPNNSGGLLPS